MAELSTLARPYAKAAFDYAKEHNAIKEWESFLSATGQVVSKSRHVPLQLCCIEYTCPTGLSHSIV